MSDEYVRKNSESIMELFYKRSVYLVDANNDLYYDDEQNLVDFGFAEKFLYGRVNREYIPLVLNTPLMPLQELSTLPGTAGGLRVPVYVAAAFNDLAAQFDKSRMGHKILADRKYLSNIGAFKAYEDPRILYSEHSNSIQQVMTEYYITHNLYFKNFDEFLIHFKHTLLKTAPQFPITLPAYVKSKRCPMRASGLVVEIADLDFSNDQEKMQYFVNDPNWSFYLNACRTYGFSVDKRAPWRLVADIASRPMLEYAARYGYTNTDMILGASYLPAHAEFYREFKAFLLKFYNLLKVGQFTEREFCQSGITLQKTVYPQEYTADRLSRVYGEEFFLNLYFWLRFTEEEQQFSLAEQNRLTTECIDIYKLKLTDRSLSTTDAAVVAVGIFEKILNKTYTYKGSLTDYANHVRILAEEQE